MKIKLSLVFILLLIFTGCREEQIEKKRQYGALGDKAMVVSANELATKVGVSVMKNGGNAFDAAVAVKFALAVVYPRAGNIGGGGFAVFRKKNGDIGALDFREKAPEKASRDMFVGEDGEVIQMKSRIGHQAAGVPGSVAGMWELHQQHGSKPWNQLLQPAVELAYYGFTISQDQADELNEKQDDFKQANTYQPWVIRQEMWQAGDSVFQKELAATISFIRDHGRDGFYKGIVATQIIREMARGNGLITQIDLDNYQALWREPVTGTYQGYKIFSMPPPSSGGVALLQLIRGAESYDFSKSGHNTSESIHLMSELERRVYADRATYLGDPDHVDVPVEMLLSRSYNQARNRSIKRKKATRSNEVKEGKVDVIESVETTHFSIADPFGNAIAVTTTINSFFGCKVMVKGAGFFLNNEMDDFSAKPGVPNMFGLVGSEANNIQPGKRMLSSMTPTIIEKDNKLFMVLGTPGGATIITSVFQTILNVIDHGMSMQESVSAKRTHHQWLPDRLIMEQDGFSTETISELEQFGHELEFRNNWGRVDAILVHGDTLLEGGADPRKDEYAEGF